MDFNKFDSVTASEKGAEYHVCHPVSGDPLYDNPKGPTVKNSKPCIVMIKGGESETARKANRDLQKARAEEDEGKTPETLDRYALHDRMVEAVAPRIMGFKNIHKDAKEATPGDAKWFLNLNRMNHQEDERSFAQQLADFSETRAGYLGNGSDG